MAEEVERKIQLNKTCILLIVIAGMERFAYKGVASNLVTYLTDVVKMSNSSAAGTVNSWCGFTSMLPLLVAPLVDSYWDRYYTILASSSLYALGLLALTSTALQWPWHPSSKNSSTVSLFMSLYLISLGQGGYNPSLQAFGADQLDIDDELPSTNNDLDDNSETKSLFFQWWYFGICSGSLLGISLLAYIQDTLGWGLGFAIPTIAMVSSITLFSCGTRFYVYKQAQSGNVKSLGNVLQTIKATAWRMISMSKGSSISLSKNNFDLVEMELQEKSLCQQEQEDDEDEDLIESPKNCNYMYEIAKVILRLLPIWTMLLMFAVIFQQPPTFFTKQGMTMKRNIGTHFRIPPATLQSAITVSIILLMPFYDAFFIPFARFVTRNEKGISVMQRMGIGMFLSVIAMIIAAIVETKRLEISRTSGFESETVALSIFWLLPQYVLLGISDIFTVVGMQEFFYSEVPVSMRTMGIALYTSVFGVGSFLSALLISCVEYFSSSNGKQGWFSDDMGEGRLDKYYWLLALLSALSLILYVFLCRVFKSRVRFGY